MIIDYANIDWTTIQQTVDTKGEATIAHKTEDCVFGFTLLNGDKQDRTTMFNTASALADLRLKAGSDVRISAESGRYVIDSVTCY
jgi:hypothetical protein